MSLKNNHLGDDVDIVMKYEYLLTIPRMLLVGMLLVPCPARTQEALQAVHLGSLLAGEVGRHPMAGPLGMYVDPRGFIYIADTGNNRLLKCGRDGRLVVETGGFGFDAEQFDRPVDIWAGNGLDVLVADYNNHRLQWYDKDLNFLATYKSDPSIDSRLQFGYPAALAQNLEGELYLVDHDFKRVLRFDTFGAPIGSFGDFNWGEGGLVHPAKIMINRRGEIFVSDSLQNRIIVYDAFGNFISALAPKGLNRPAGMAEWQNSILIADRANHRVVLMNRDGELLGSFGHDEKPGSTLRSPVAVAILRQEAKQQDKLTYASAVVLVLDSGTNCLQQYELRRLRR